jgi:hypothetical protein
MIAKTTLALSTLVLVACVGRSPSAEISKEDDGVEPCGRRAAAATATRIDAADLGVGTVVVGVLATPIRFVTATHPIRCSVAIVGWRLGSARPSFPDAGRGQQGVDGALRERARSRPTDELVWLAPDVAELSS